MNDRQAKKLYKRIKKTRDDYIANKTNDYLNFIPRCVSYVCWQSPICLFGKAINRLIVLNNGTGGDIDEGNIKMRNNFKALNRMIEQQDEPHRPTLDEKKDLFREGE